VRSSTSAPVHAVPAGDHRLGATAGATIVPLRALRDVAETALVTAPPAATTDPTLERGARVAGRTPIALWFTRAVASDPVEVAIRVADPLGRVTERTETVPGWTPPPPLDLTLIDVFAIAGRGVAISVSSDAPVDAVPPYTLAVRASQGGRPRPFPVPWHIPIRRPLAVSTALPDIPRSRTPTAGGGIQLGWRTDDAHARIYDIWVPLLAPVVATITLIAPDGGQLSVVASSSG
jgi:hypothetical protein